VTVTPVRVGIIGVGPDPRSWARRAHIPALQSLPDLFSLSAIVGRRAPELERIAAEIGAERYFLSTDDLLRSDDVDLVVIVVKTPGHSELAADVVRSGKHVYCEWPLGSSSQEAAEVVAGLPTASSVHTVVGLQTRLSPAVAQAKEVIDSGDLGALTSVVVHVARGRTANGRIDDRAAYQLDRRNGSGLLEVLGGHTFDAVEHLAGRFQRLQAVSSIRRPEIRVAETGETITVTTPDHVALAGIMENGAVASILVHDGEAGVPRTLIEIAGTLGTLRITSKPEDLPSDRQISIVDLRLEMSRDGSWMHLPTPAEFLPATPVATRAGRNLAMFYRRLWQDLNDGVTTLPTFEDGLRLHRVVDGIRASAEAGEPTLLSV
jgi:predicted dehydrogenase